MAVVGVASPSTPLSHLGVLAGDDGCEWVEAADDGCQLLQCLTLQATRQQVHLVEQVEVSTLHLLHKQVNHGAHVAAITQLWAGR